MAMHTVSPACSGSARRLRRAGGGLLLAVQVAISALALFEPRAAMRLGVHVEQDGTLHADQHNDDSCAVCAVRALSAVPSQGGVALSATYGDIAPQAATLLPPPAVRFVSRYSRAPPTLPG